MNTASEDCRNSFITNEIVSRKILTECSLVIASCSVPSSHFSNTIVDQRALILGFTKDSHIVFIDNVLKGSNSKINCLKDCLASNPIINNLCNIPLIINLLIWFVEEGMNKMITDSHISLIQKYIMMIIKNKSNTSLTELPNPYDEVIKDLSQFATIAVQNLPTFTVDDILEFCDNQFKVYWHGLDVSHRIFELGLLNRICFQAQNADGEIFYYCHVTIQEYLAAYHISLLPDDELLKLLGGTSWNIQYLNVWMTYVDISGCKNSIFKDFLSKSSDILKITTTKEDSHKSTLITQDIDLKLQKLSYDHVHILAVLLSKSTNKQWKSLKLSNCDIDSKGCTLLSKMLSSNMDLKFETVDISYNNFCWESFCTICSKLKDWHSKDFVFSINSLYDTATMNEINHFIALLKKYFQNITFSKQILLLTYVPEQNKLTAVYLAPYCIRWLEWTDCKLNEDAVKAVQRFVEIKVRNESFKIAFSYSIVGHHVNNEELSTLLSDIQGVHLCGPHLHSKGAYLLNIASTIDGQYNSPQELVADYLAAALSYNLQPTVSYLESLSTASATVVKDSLQNLIVFDISGNSIDSHIATEIATILSITSTLEIFCASGNNMQTENAIIIAKGLQNCSTLSVFNMSSNNICEIAAHDIGTVLSHNTNLQRSLLNDNKFNAVGMIEIVKALQNVSTLIAFNINNNNVGEEAADNIGTVSCSNTKLKKLHLGDNNFMTKGMIKIMYALQNISTLTAFNISNNNVGGEAVDSIAAVLSHNTELQELYLSKNNFKTESMIKIAKALQNISALTAFHIHKNHAGEEAAGEIAAVLSRNTKLKTLYLDSNDLKTEGIIKIAKALQNTSTLTKFRIGNNDIGEEAANHIAIVLSCNTELQELSLCNNNFRASGVLKITEALTTIITLTKYDISCNNIEESAVATVRDLLSWNIKLKLWI